MAELMEYLKQAVGDQASDLFIVAGGAVTEKAEGRLRPISEVAVPVRGAGCISKTVQPV